MMNDWGSRKRSRSPAKAGSKVEIAEVIPLIRLPPKNYQKSKVINYLSTIQSNQLYGMTKAFSVG